jgi:hypothetical protein
MAMAVEMAVAVADVVALVVMIGLVAMVEVALAGGRSRGGNDRSTIINGIDVSDLTQKFTDKEWRKLA